MSVLKQSSTINKITLGRLFRQKEVLLFCSGEFEKQLAKCTDRVLPVSRALLTRTLLKTRTRTGTMVPVSGGWNEEAPYVPL